MRQVGVVERPGRLRGQLGGGADRLRIEPLAGQELARGGRLERMGSDRRKSDPAAHDQLSVQLQGHRRAGDREVDRPPPAKLHVGGPQTGLGGQANFREDLVRLLG